MRKLLGPIRPSIAMLPLLMALMLVSCSLPAHEASRSSAEGGRTPAEGYLAGAGGARIFYRVLGSGPDTLAAIHGGPGAGMNAILPELEPLARHHTLIFFDQRGGGRSELPSDTSLLTAAYFVSDLEAVRRFFGLQQMNVIAHSFGTIIAAQYAREYPEHLERMIFFGGVGPNVIEAGKVRRAATAQVDPAVQRLSTELLRALMTGTTSDPVADCLAFEEIGRKLEIAEGGSGKWKGSNCSMHPDALRYYWRYTARLGVRAFGRWEFTSSLKHVEAPLLVIHGDRNRAAVELQKGWVRAVPNGRLLLVRGASKAVSADRPDIFYPAVSAFLSGEWPVGAEAVREE